MFCGLTKKKRPGYPEETTSLGWACSVVLPGESDLGTQRKPPDLDGRSVVLPGESDLGTPRKPAALDGHILWSYQVS